MLDANFPKDKNPQDGGDMWVHAEVADPSMGHYKSAEQEPSNQVFVVISILLVHL